MLELIYSQFVIALSITLIILYTDMQLANEIKTQRNYVSLVVYQTNKYYYYCCVVFKTPYDETILACQWMTTFGLLSIIVSFVTYLVFLAGYPTLFTEVLFQFFAGKTHILKTNS